MSCLSLSFLLLCSLGIYPTTARKVRAAWCLRTDIHPPEPRIYDPRKFDCKSGEVVSKGLLRNTNHQVPESYFSSASLQNSTQTNRNAERKTSPAKSQTGFGTNNGTCSGPEDELICHSILHCGRASGYKCCGFGRYNPQFQTCCLQLWHRFAIHDHKPERKHVCCDLDVHRRSAAIPCLHPARNDGMWRARHVRRRQRHLVEPKLCLDYGFVAVVKVEERVEENERTFYSAKITTLQNGGFPIGSAVKKNIPIDSYSPKRHLARRWFLVYSRVDLLKNTLDFYLRPGDIVFKGRNGRSLKRKAMTSYKICKVISTMKRKVKDAKLQQIYRKLLRIRHT